MRERIFDFAIDQSWSLKADSTIRKAALAAVLIRVEVLNFGDDCSGSGLSIVLGLLPHSKH